MEPSTFDWWSGVWIPVISSVITLLVAGASLFVASLAMKAAQDAKVDARRFKRMEQGASLVKAMNSVVLAIWNGKFDDAFTAARDANGVVALLGDKRATSIAGQLLYWGMYAMQHHPNESLRQDIGAEILFKVEAAIAAYVADDEGKWSLEARNIDDITRRD